MRWGDDMKEWISSGATVVVAVVTFIMLYILLAAW